jgi:hypothetical protein
VFLLNWPFLSESVVDTTYLPDRLVDTDRLNAELSLLALCMLKEYSPSFSTLDLSSALLREGITRRPPCRWETFSHVVQSTRRRRRREGEQEEGEEKKEEVTVTAVLDMGHNPAAIRALCRRIKRDLGNKHVRYLKIYIVRCPD